MAYQDDVQYSAMHFLELCANGDLRSLQKILCTRKGDINFQHPVNGRTGLHWACARSHGRVVDLLLLNGADFNLKDSEGRTAADLSKDVNIRKSFGLIDYPSELPADPEMRPCEVASASFVPNYMNNPTLFETPIKTSATLSNSQYSTAQTPGRVSVLIRIPNVAYEAYKDIRVDEFGPQYDVESFKREIQRRLDWFDVQDADWVLVKMPERLLVNCTHELQKLQNGDKLEIIQSDQSIVTWRNAFIGLAVGVVIVGVLVGVQRRRR